MYLALIHSEPIGAWLSTASTTHGARVAAEETKSYVPDQWRKYLKERKSTPELTQQSWHALGESGDPPMVGFWAPADGCLPVFTRQGLARATVVSIISRAKVPRMPPELSPVALYRSPYGVSPVFRLRDLESYRTKNQNQSDAQRRDSPTAANILRNDLTPALAVSPPLPSLPSFRIPLEAPRVRTVHIHCGATNSGKTWGSLRRLAEAGYGAYLAPLRLLAWEAYESLKEMHCPADLLTGEEVIQTPGARVVAATTEMFPPRRYDVVVIDEAQMVGDTERGWAWLRALVTANTDELHVCCAPHGLAFLKRLFAVLGDRVTVHQYERLSPLHPVSQHVSLNRLPERSAVVAFSRLAVLRLKAEIERSHKVPCAAIYGALPPDVRRAQARRVHSGESPFVVATDAIGMGVNFPVDHVFLFSSEKFDGSRERSLYPEEMRQIIGRAGRYGMSKAGYYGGMSKAVHASVLALAVLEPRPIQHAFLRPTAAQLSELPGPLAERIRLWRKLAKPVHEDLVKVAPVQQLIELAALLPSKVEKNLEQAFKLITAPVDRAVMGYWRVVVEAVMDVRPIPSPGMAPQEIRNDVDLERAEQALKERELCLWFLRWSRASSTPEVEVRAERNRIAAAIDRALAAGIISGACRSCGKSMYPGHRHRICNACHRANWGGLDG